MKKMTIIDIISSVTTANYQEDKVKFLKYFGRLYALPILNPMLNVVVTKAKVKKLSFNVEPLRKWDRIAGHCQTTGFFSKVTGMFEKENKILIKTIEPDIIIHEIGHAIEKEAKVDLNGDFRKAIGLDLNGRVSPNPQVAAAVTKVMRDDLKGYKINNVMEELFARYFELLAYSVEIIGWRSYQFAYSDISGFFLSTTNWVEQYLNPILEKITDSSVKKLSDEYKTTLVDNYKKQWSDNVKSTHSEKTTIHNNAAGAFSARIKSSNDWLNSWQSFSGANTLEGNKTNLIENEDN